MKSIILILCLIIVPSSVSYAKGYKHKTEAELAQMTPAQRVDEFANEQAYHKYRSDDDYYKLLEKYVYLDGLKAVPRAIEIIDEYDPTRSSGRSGRKGERYDGAGMLLADIDMKIIRLRASEEGRRAIAALERSVERMKAAHYGQPEQQEWKNHGRFGEVELTISELKETNHADVEIQSTFRYLKNIEISDAEMIGFSNFLTAKDSAYPAWSKTKGVVDDVHLSPAGDPVRISVFTEPEKFFEAYSEFKKIK